jgi:hypothetical protein
MTLLDEPTRQSLVTLAASAVRQEYPHQLEQELNSDDDLRPPRELNPSFYGSYDWHSAVHNHWLLVTALRRGLPSPSAETATALLNEHLNEERLAVEAAFFRGAGGRTAERPYGWAWLLVLHAECQAGGDGPYRRWAVALAPLADLFCERLDGYFGGGLAFPIRSGTHANTAFSPWLTIQAARRRGDQRTADTLSGAARRLFGADQVLPWAEDPSGDAFLTPPLTEAALMADVLSPREYADWLERVLPDPSAAAWTPPVFRLDGADPGTVHLEGLLISRAWCLDAIGRALPPGHNVAAAALTAAGAHLKRIARLDPAAGFNRSHWIPTFLVYLDEQLRG